MIIEVRNLPDNKIKKISFEIEFEDGTDGNLKDIKVNPKIDNNECIVNVDKPVDKNISSTVYSGEMPVFRNNTTKEVPVEMLNIEF